MTTVSLATPVALLFAATQTLADNSAQQLETVLVRAAREPIQAELMGSAVTVLTEDLLANRQSASLGEILRSVPGHPLPPQRSAAEASAPA